MEFALATDQEQLQKEARAYLRERFTAERVSELADSEAGWDPESWRELAELGWLGVTIPETQGGIGFGWVEQALLFEELGRVLYPGPYFSTVALALPALTGALAAEVAAGATRWSAEVGGLVPDLAIVERVVTAAGFVEADGEALPTVDTTRRYGRLRDRSDVSPVALAPAFVALAAEAVGVAARALEYGVEHAQTREQFGKPIGVYQAVSHPLVDSYVELEMARSLAYAAAWTLDHAPERARIAAAQAKAFAAETAVRASERSIQIHGGIGFSWEHPLHRYYKRAQWIESFGGFPAAQRAVVADDLLA